MNFIKENYEADIREMQQYFPVICGEWCLFNSLAVGKDTKGGQTVLNGQEGMSKESISDAEKKQIYREGRQRLFLLELQTACRYRERDRLGRLGQLGSWPVRGFRVVSGGVTCRDVYWGSGREICHFLLQVGILLGRLGCSSGLYI